MSLIKILIGNNERQFDDIYNVDESWINQQINKRKEDKEKVCVRVYIKNEFIDILLTTPACEGGVVEGYPIIGKKKYLIFGICEN